MDGPLQFLNSIERFKEYEILYPVFLNYLSKGWLFSENDIFKVFNFQTAFIVWKLILQCETIVCQGQFSFRMKYICTKGRDFGEQPPIIEKHLCFHQLVPLFPPNILVSPQYF